MEQEMETCQCGARVPTGDTGLCVTCEFEDWFGDFLVESSCPQEADGAFCRPCWNKDNGCRRQDGHVHREDDLGKWPFMHRHAEFPRSEHDAMKQEVRKWSV